MEFFIFFSTRLLILGIKIAWQQNDIKQSYLQGAWYFFLGGGGGEGGVARELRAAVVFRTLPTTRLVFKFYLPHIYNDEKSC